MIKVSVIVPVYNVEKYLSKCLDSLVNQTLQDIEIIAINDGSTDRSSDVLKSYKEKYPDMIKIINQEHKGHGYTRNVGIKYAKGKYIGSVDADDYIDVNTYKEMYEYMEDKKLDIVYWDFTIVGEDGNTFVKKSNLNLDYNNINNMFIMSNPSCCNKLIRTKIFKDNNLKFIEGRQYEDFSLIPSLVKYTNRIEYVEKSYYYYFQRANSTMRPKSYTKKLMDILYSYKYLYKQLDNEKYRDIMEYIAIYQLLYISSSRFLKYNKENDFEKCIDYVKETFPNWKSNIYLKNNKRLFRLYLNILSNKMFFVAKVLLKVRGNL